MYKVLNLKTGKERKFLSKPGVANHLIKLFDRHQEFTVSKNEAPVFYFLNTDSLLKVDEKETHDLTVIIHNKLAKRRKKAGIA